MEKLSRKELIDYIEKQDVKNNEYRKRFRDLVTAYKGLQNEKTALENSLTALSSSRNEGTLKEPPKTANPEDTTSSEVQTDVEVDNASVEPLPSQDRDSVSHDVERIEALSRALATLTEEKNRKEGSLLADKKKLMQDLDELKKEFEAKEKTFQQEKLALQKSIRELRADIGKEQHQRQEDQNQQTLMMRELQAKLINERANKEKFEQQYESLLLQQKNSRPASGQRSAEEYEKMLEDLTKEMARLRKMQREATENAKRPNPVLIKLQSDMKDIKMKHKEAVADEQRQSCHAKAELRSLALSSENRITSLEAKVAELSQMIGNYDRLRTQDQTNIQKLKERIAQLDTEKSLLLQQQVSGGRVKLDDDLQDDSNLDIHALADKIAKLKEMLYMANQRSQKPLDPQILLRLQETSLSNGDLHARCKEELEQLKDEFEHYKTRAQTVLRSKSVKDQENHGEVESLRHQLKEVKVRLNQSRAQYDKQLKSSDEVFQAAEQEHRQQLHQLRAQLEAEHSAKLLGMEQQMQRQRERTLALLEEKEKDLAHKDKQLASLINSTPFLQKDMDSYEHAQTDRHIPDTSPGVPSSESLPEMLSHAMTASSGDHLILHYVQDIARKDVEIGTLRRARHQAETTLRELQRDSQTKEERYRDDLEAMQAKIYRLECSQSEEGMNMEYLKNVVLRYILCKDIEGKRRILNAIAAVLHFTVRELEQARVAL